MSYMILQSVRISLRIKMLISLTNKLMTIPLILKFIQVMILLVKQSEPTKAVGMDPRLTFSKTKSLLIVRKRKYH
jgi:hypothetical protein